LYIWIGNVFGCQSIECKDKLIPNTFPNKVQKYYKVVSRGFESWFTCSKTCLECSINLRSI